VAKIFMVDAEEVLALMWMWCVGGKTESDSCSRTWGVWSCWFHGSLVVVRGGSAV